VGELEVHLRLSEAERAGVVRAVQQGLSLRITPYYLGLCDPLDPRCPIRRQVVPQAAEQVVVDGDMTDPLGEQEHEPAPHLLQRYPDRALLLVTNQCAIHCRFCTRSRLVGTGRGVRSLAAFEPALQYLADHPQIRELILSGGDPLLLGTDRLVALLKRIRQLSTIDVIRLATRTPACLPARITDELVAALRPYQPLWLMVHFNHPRELSPAAEQACLRLADGGFPVLSQTVLLRGVNDSASVLERLFRQLIRLRVRPYYLLQADPVQGSAHLRTPIETGLQIMEQLQGRLSGIALPKLVVDTPGGKGKVPLCPDYLVRREGKRTSLRTFRNETVDYVDPPRSDEPPNSG